MDELKLDTGALSLEQINLVLKNLPVDLTFVDENDEVRYFSAGKERIFSRSAGIIGRRVQNCHPEKSVHIVNRILDEFKAGTRDVAGFWIQLKGKFIYIRYFAIRDEQGKYRGTLEVTQDITEIKKLEGERRLLDWGHSRDH
jgi:PAS domain S-box-containing protein